MVITPDSGTLQDRRSLRQDRLSSQRRSSRFHGQFLSTTRDGFAFGSRETPKPETTVFIKRGAACDGTARPLQMIEKRLNVIDLKLKDERIVAASGAFHCGL
jgi:hypothetical protein